MLKRAMPILPLVYVDEPVTKMWYSAEWYTQSLNCKQGVKVVYICDYSSPASRV